MVFLSSRDGVFHLDVRAPFSVISTALRRLIWENFKFKNEKEENKRDCIGIYQ